MHGWGWLCRPSVWKCAELSEMMSVAVGPGAGSALIQNFEGDTIRFRGGRDTLVETVTLAWVG